MPSGEHQTLNPEPRTLNPELNPEPGTWNLEVVIYGINPVLEALRAGRVKELRVSDRGGDRMRALLALAAERQVRVRQVTVDLLARDARGGVHQGVVAEVEAPERFDVEALVRGAGGVPLIVVLDGVEDPHNMGAILRTADAAGTDGVIVQSRHASALGGAAAKASAGAVAHVRIAEVVNIARSIEELKSLGVWTVGLAEDGAHPYDMLDLTLPTAIVLGGEGSGLRRLVRERCDMAASIPMRGHVESLNVSVAAGIVLFEAVRQRRRTATAGLGLDQPPPA
jgi:23S rRNA (guanosine2251-2'-O)-methyltransferase